MNPQISPSAFDTFFAWAPWVIGIVIYLIFYFAKRAECARVPVTATNSGPVTATFSCSQCGRIGTVDQMAAQARSGAVTYVCARCSPGD